MLLMMMDRVLESKKLTHIIIATSRDKTDDAIEFFCKQYKFPFYRGSLYDVLDRFYQVAQIYEPDHIVRMTADCPLIDPGVIDKTIEYHLLGDYDYTRNMGFPDGLDVEVMTNHALTKAWKEGYSSYEREHVTPYFNLNPILFNIGYYRNNKDLSRVKISVDTQEDLERVEKLILTILEARDSLE
jgi:spore coat polysaccharide biosynthesis protein SpsF